jgi:hypothetical protein
MESGKAEILNELKEKFAKMKADVGFKASFEELDEIFFLKDAVLGAGFVSETLSRQVCARIAEDYNLWMNYLHGVIFTNPGNLIAMTESKILGEAGRKSASGLLSKMASLISTNMLIGVTKDKKMEAEFIDGSVEFWNKTFKPEITRLLEQLNKGWKEK